MMPFSRTGRTACVLLLLLLLLSADVLADAYYIPGATWNGAGAVCEMSGVYGSTPAEVVALHFPAHNEATGLACQSNPCCCPAAPAGFDATAFYEVSACAGTAQYRYRIYRVLDPKNPPACGTGGREGGVSNTAGNPVNVATGNKHQVEIDLSLPETGLSFVRYYNSNAVYSDDYGLSQDVGKQWRTGFSATLLVLADASSDPNSTLPAPVIKARRADGRLVTFTRTNGQWGSEADIHLSLRETAAGYAITAPDGVTEEYALYANGKARVVRIVKPNGMAQTLAYDTANRLETVTGPYGHKLVFTYSGGRLATLTGPAGQTHVYSYDSNANLEYVYSPDGTTDTWLNNPYRRYHYEKPGYVHALTGISDSLGGQELRYATFDYDAQGRATASHHANNVNRVDIAYNDADGTRIVRNSRDISSTYTTTSQLGVELVTSIAGPGCSTCGAGDAKSYHDPATNNLMYRKDTASVTLFGEYDSDGNYHCKVEGIALQDTTDLAQDQCIYDPAASPDARIIRYAYSQVFPGKAAGVTEPSVLPGATRVTTYDHDAFGNRTLERVQGYRPDGVPVVRETRWTYGGPHPGDCPESEAPFHQLCRIDGPRTDVADITTLRYWPFDPGAAAHGPDDGRLKEIEDAKGNLVRHDIHYTATGKVRYEYDANGVMTGYDYYPGTDRLQRIGVTGNAGTHYTEWTYLETGEVETITTAHGSSEATTLTFGYDDARRLARVTDGLGNVISYTLDTEGNVTGEEILDARGTPSDTLDDVLRLAVTRGFDAYNRLSWYKRGDDPASPLESYQLQYATAGMLDSGQDGNGRIRTYSYDTLKRLLSVTQDLGGADPATADALTQYDYDAADRLARVTDPRNGTTTYRYDDLGNLLSVTSPDTGVTAFTYDDAGNMKTKTTAAGTGEAVVLAYGYDALNRLVHVTTPDPLEDITYTYDSCRNGAGRLCAVGNGHGTVTYTYDAYGNVATHQGVSYTYDSANRVRSLSYPSGAIVSYVHDAAGRVSHVELSIHGRTTSLASGIAHAPFGGIDGLVYGNGLALNRQWDTAYRMVGQNISGVLSQDYPLYDGNGNLMQRLDAGGITGTFAYDARDRLVSASGTFGSGWHYDYDRNGNRTLMNEGATVALGYGPDINNPGGVSNRLDRIGNASVILDLAGNTLASGNRTYSYSPHHRLQAAGDGSGTVATFAYNGLGQRVAKEPAGSYDKRFFYGLNGELLVETDVAGNSLVEYIYLDGQLLAVYHPDADGDGESNLQAAEAGNPAVAGDTDVDGLTDADELLVYGTSPTSPDTDGDGVDDGTEVAYATNPLDPGDFVLPGDINADGRVNLADYILLMQYLASWKTPTGSEQDAADMNRNGRLDAGDAAVLMRKVLGLARHSLSNSATVQTLLTALEGIFHTAEAAITSGSLYYVHNDHLGTPLVMTDEGGDIVWQADYAPFGRTSVGMHTVDLNVRFPGQYYDQETGLHYNVFRYYDPSTGRYLTSDPVGLASDLNTYAYVANNPVLWIDPLGLKTFTCRKPLDAIGGSGTRSGPDILGNPLFHGFLCVKNGDVDTCGGQDRTGGPFSPGKPSDDTFVPQQCDEAAPDNYCLEQCLVDAFSGPRPFYGLLGPGTNCQEWAGDVLSRCKRQCDLTKKCSARGCNR